MPLIVLCGIPGSGKTKRSSQISQYLQSEYGCKVIIVNEESLGITKEQGYANAQQQKVTRGRVKFEVQRNLIGDTIVIADSLNYIKGFRYQLYCVARQQKTTYCVVYCNTPVQNALEFNKINENRFSNELLIDYAQRMEAPQLKNRWDIPLFERRYQQPTPVSQIAQVLLFEAKKSKDPVSTKQQQKLSQDYLYQVDKICQQICEQVCLGKIKMRNSWSVLQTRKVKNDFIGFLKQKPIAIKIIRDTFTNFFLEADKRK